jgi:hypothetical protein
MGMDAFRLGGGSMVVEDGLPEARELLAKDENARTEGGETEQGHEKHHCKWHDFGSSRNFLVVGGEEGAKEEEYAEGDAEDDQKDSKDQSPQAEGHGSVAGEHGRPRIKRRGRIVRRWVGIGSKKAGEGVRTLDIHVGNVTLYH